MDKLKILFTTSELYPLSKTGGLADVSNALPRYLGKNGHDVTVFTPGYKLAHEYIAEHNIPCHKLEYQRDMWIGDELYVANYYQVEISSKFKVILVDNSYFFNRESLYQQYNTDYDDNCARFSFFCRALLEFILDHPDYIPDVIHCNDWQTGLIPFYLQSVYSRSEFEQTKTLFTIHNIAYQGKFNKYFIYSTGLSWDYFTFEGLEFYDALNLLKAGIIASDAITTVSPNYALEILQPEKGYGLEGVLLYYKDKLAGILNGIDTDIWNPASDKLIPANFSRADLSGKRICRQKLLDYFDFDPEDKQMLFGFIGRLVDQKGVDLLVNVIPDVVEKLNCRIVILGAGDIQYQQELLSLSERYPNNIGLFVGFNEELAHLIEAGADAFLMPSLYEPCGLNQMYSQAYGTVPIVYETGGLKDTVTHYDCKKDNIDVASGFLFTEYSALRFYDAIYKANQVFNDKPNVWMKIVQNCMAIDYSWDKVVNQYINLYHEVLE